MTVVLSDKQGIESFDVQLTVSMSKYQVHLKSKYSSLPLSSPEELLECNSSEYVSLLLKRFNEQTQTSEEKLISTPIDHLFSKSLHGNKRTKKEGECLTLDDILDVRRKKNKVILIEGGPGMGKSTLAIKLCKSWADGELLQEYDAVILLPLRDPEIQEARTIKDLLLIMHEELRDEVYKEIVQEDGNRVCFMLEGYDELPQKLRSAPIFSKLTERLPRCTLVYTSRPEPCDKLRRLAAHKIEICGFKEEQIDEYIKNAFEKVENGKEKAMKLISQVESNPTVKSILCVPINVAIICHLFLLTLQLPNTLTQLYTLLCLNLMLRHINKQNDGDAEIEYLDSFDDLPTGTSEQFLNLCLIAYRGRVDDRIVFSSRDLKGYGIDASKIIGLGLLLIAPSTSVYGREKSYNFLHLTLQEFCAAFYISKLPTQDQLECFKQHKYRDNFKKIWRFYSGITGLRNNSLLYEMLPSKLILVYSHYRGKRTIELLHRVYEAQNADVCQLVGSHLDGKFFLFGYELDKTDCTAVGYLLKQYRGEVKLVNCRKCYIDDDCFEILVNSLLSHSGNYSSHLQLDFNDHYLTMDKSCSLITSLLSSNLLIVSLDMGNEDGFDIYSTLCNSLHHNNILKELVLNKAGLQPKQMQLLGKSLSNNNTLSVLDISNSNVGPDGCQHLANVRSTSLSELIMMDCGVGINGANHIGKMLVRNKSTLSIDLSYNNIKDDGVKMLVEHLASNTTLKKLDLECNDITSIGAGYLSKLFTCNPCTVNDIILQDNPLGDKGVDLILQSITAPMELVGLRNTGMTLRGPSLICMALLKIKLISFTPPDNCDNISNSLADTTVLEGLMLFDGSDAAYNTIITGISRNNSIKSLYCVNGILHHQSVRNLAKVIQVNKIITMILIAVVVSDASDYLLLAKATAVNTSIKNMILFAKMDKPQSLQFIKQLKHNYSLEVLVLHGIDQVEDDDQFNRDVEMLVEEINYTRQHNGVTTLLYVSMSSRSIENDISYHHFKQVNIYVYNLFHITCDHE